MNKGMKKIAFLLIALFTTGTILMAQGGPRGRQGGQRNMDPKDRAERMTERMVKEYSLNDTQKKEVYEVNLAMAQKMTPPQKADSNKEAKKDNKVKDKACCENCANCDSCKAAQKEHKGKHAKKGKMGERPSKEDREKMMAEMKKSREDYDVKIKKIFTKDQYEAYTKKQEERQNKMANRGQRAKQTSN